jgi:hypothetical protein
MANVKYFIQLLGIASEKKLLETSLTIGSEGCDLTGQHEHLALHHCTIFMQSGVLSIVDHNSDFGVEVNGTRIPPNKMIIILPTDKMLLGKLELKIYLVDELDDESNDKTMVIRLDDELQLSAQSAESDWKELPIAPIEDIIEPTLAAVPADQELSQTKIINLEVTEEDSWQEMTLKPAAKVEPVVEKKVEENVEEKAIVEEKLELTKIITHPAAAQPVQEKSVIKNVYQKKYKRAAPTTVANKDFEFTHTASVGMPLRLTALLIDAIMGLRLSLFAAQQKDQLIYPYVEQLSSFCVQFTSNLHPMLEPYAEYLSAAAPVFAGYLFVRLFFIILFGASAGQLLLLCTHRGNFFVKRIFGPIRELMGLMTGPLLVFDLPALFGKKTVKELLTMTGLRCFSPLIAYCLAPIMLTGVYMLCFLTPLLVVNPLEDKIVVVHSQVHTKVDLATKLLPLWSSAQLKMRGPFHAPGQTALLGYQYKNKSGKRVPLPILTIYQKAFQASMRIELQGSFDWKVELTKLFALNPYLRWKYNQLYEFSSGKKIIPAQFSDELRALIKSIYELRYSNFFFFIIKNGPYFEPLLNFRLSLEKALDISVEQIEFMRIGKREYVKFSQEANVLTGLDRIKFYVLPIASTPATIWTFSYKKTSTTSKDFLENVFLPQVKYDANPDQKSQWSSLTLQNQMNATALMDYLQFSNITEEQRSLINKNIYNFLWNISIQAISASDEVFYGEVLKSMRQLLAYLVDVNSVLRKTIPGADNALTQVGHDGLIKNLSVLIDALEHKKTDFFTGPPNYI